MRRWILAAAVGTGFILGSVADDAKKADSPLQAEYDKYKTALKEKMDEVRRAAPVHQKELASEVKEYQVIELDKLFELAEQEPTTEPAFQVFSELMFTALDKAKMKKARDLVAQHHLAQPHVKKILFDLAYNQDPKVDHKPDELLAGVIAKNTDKDALGHAHVALAMVLKAKAKQTSGQDKTDLTKKAVESLSVAKAKYADVKAGDGTVGKLADGLLAALKLADQLQIGKAVPDIGGDDLDGKAFKLSDYKGKVVMLSFWATWCPPCMALVPHERELVEKLKGKPFALIGVNGDELTDAVRKTIADKQITWRSFQDQQKDQPALSDAWGIEGWPTIYIIDHVGVIRHMQTGSLGADKLDALIDTLVKDAEKK
jgi:thiol-disulfide isomerase/thioredoxin